MEPLMLNFKLKLTFRLLYSIMNKNCLFDIDLFKKYTIFKNEIFAYKHLNLHPNMVPIWLNIV
jgi:hypothetical protein